MSKINEGFDLEAKSVEEKIANRWSVNPSLEWKNAIEIQEGFRPAFDHRKLIYETDAKFEQQFRLISISRVNPTSYRKAKRVKAIETVFTDSMIDCGQITPITVIKCNHKKYDYNVLFGANRVNALLNKGEDLVYAIEIKCEDKVLLELIKIDESLVRTELTALERIRLLSKRRSIYEQLYPESTAEKQRQRGLNVSDEKNSRLKKHESFTKNMAMLTGKNRRTIQLALQAGMQISKENLDLIQGSKLEDNNAEIMKLAKIQDPELQTNILQAVLSGQADNIQDGLKLFTEKLILKPSSNTPENKDLSLRHNLKLANFKIKELKKANSELSGKVKQLELKAKNLAFAKIPAIPELY